MRFEKVSLIIMLFHIDPADINIIIYVEFFTNSLAKRNDNDKLELWSKNLGEMSASAAQSNFYSLFKLNELLIMVPNNITPPPPPL